MPKKQVSKARENHPREARVNACASFLRISRFWQLVALLSILNLFGYLVVRDLKNRLESIPVNVDTYLSFIILVVFILLTFRIFDIPISWESFYRRRKFVVTGFLIIVSSNLIAALLFIVSQTLFLYLLFAFLLLFPLSPLFVAYKYAKITAPFAEVLAKEEFNLFRNSLEDQSLSEREINKLFARLSFYFDFRIGSSQEKELYAFAPTYQAFLDAKNFKANSSEDAQQINSLAKSIGEHFPKTTVHSLRSYPSNVNDGNLCKKYDAGKVFLPIAMHWLLPKLRVYKRFLLHIITNPEQSYQQISDSPKNDYEKKLLQDFEKTADWERKFNSVISFMVIAIVLYGLDLALYNTNIRISEIYSLAIKSNPSLAQTVDLQTLPDVFLENFSGTTINTYLYFFFFIPYALVQWFAIRLLDIYAVRQKPPIINIGSRIYLISFLLTLYFPIWRIFTEKPAFMFWLIISWSLMIGSAIAEVIYIVLNIQLIITLIKSSESFVVVSLMDIYNAFEEEDLSVRSKKINQAVKRCKHYLRFVKWNRRTNDREANQVLSSFFEAFSYMLSLVVANNAMPSETDQLKQEVSKLLYVSVMRNYRKIERDLPANYQAAVEHVNKIEQRRERLFGGLTRQLILLAISFIVLLVINFLSSYLPGFLAQFSLYVDILSFLGLQ